MKGMNFIEVAGDDTERIERMLADGNYVVEQKMDGTRTMVEIRPDGSLSFTTRNGSPLKHTAALQHIPSLTEALQPIVDYCRLTESRVVIDGELLIGSGVYHPFDLPVWERPGGELLTMCSWLTHSYSDRRRALAGLLQPLVNEPRVRIVRSARSADEKRSLLEATREQGAEGVMFKALDAPYEPGKRVKHTVKVKHVKEADVVVMQAKRGTTDSGNPSGSATFGVYDDAGALVRLGSCSLIGKPDVQRGDVITVAYLYRQDDGGLVQPRMRSIRHDKAAADCGFDQFPSYSREAV